MFFCDEKIISKSSFKGFSRFDSFDDTNGIYSDYPPYPGRKSNDLSFLRALQRFVENFNFLFFCQDPFGSTYRSRKDDFSVGKVCFTNSSFDFMWLMCENSVISQVLEWISLLHEAWSLSSSTVSSLDCQKRAVCEIWRLTVFIFLFLKKFSYIFGLKHFFSALKTSCITQTRWTWYSR